MKRRALPAPLAALGPPGQQEQVLQALRVQDQQVPPDLLGALVLRDLQDLQVQVPQDQLDQQGWALLDPQVLQAQQGQDLRVLQEQVRQVQLGQQAQPEQVALEAPVQQVLRVQLELDQQDLQEQVPQDQQVLLVPQAQLDPQVPAQLAQQVQREARDLLDPLDPLVASLL